MFKGAASLAESARRQPPSTLHYWWTFSQTATQMWSLMLIVHWWVVFTSFLVEKQTHRNTVMNKWKNIEYICYKCSEFVLFMKSIYARDICKVDKHILVRIKCYVRKLTCIFNVFNFNGNSVGISEYSVGNNVKQYMILFIWNWFDKSNLFLYLILFQRNSGR